MTTERKQRVVVGMSGGVDSSSAAALLTKQGYEVIGITLKVWPQECINRSEDRCCGPDAVHDARGVAHTLGIAHYVLNESDDFKSNVIQYFANEYKAGRTPNPCVLCNQATKFPTLLRVARQLDAEFIATGHYARVQHDPAGGRSLLYRGKDLRKDQSYFLFSLGQDVLSRTLLPLGDATKADTRDVARQHQLKTADKEESMEICFVPDNDYGSFLTSTGMINKHRGKIVDLSGRVLGHHDGIEFYTIGQRKGLGISAPHPLYVVGLDPEHNLVIVGEDTALMKVDFLVDRCNWIAREKPEGPFKALAKIRYNHPGTEATVEPLENQQARVTLHVAQRAVTPGQACVFYDGDIVLGGGWIMSPEKSS